MAIATVYRTHETLSQESLDNTAIATVYGTHTCLVPRVVPVFLHFPSLKPQEGTAVTQHAAKILLQLGSQNLLKTHMIKAQSLAGDGGRQWNLQDTGSQPVA